MRHQAAARCTASMRLRAIFVIFIASIGKISAVFQSVMWSYVHLDYPLRNGSLLIGERDYMPAVCPTAIVFCRAYGSARSRSHHHAYCLAECAENYARLAGALGFAGGQPDDAVDPIDENMAPTNWLEHRVSRFVDNREGTLSSRTSWPGNTISAHLKRIGTDQGGPAPLRIHIAYQLQDLADQGKVRFLKEKLLPAMTAELARHIKVLFMCRPKAESPFLLVHTHICIKSS